MSYEGYEQLLCVNGHERVVDVYEDLKTWRCSCGEKLAWFNCVDQTNGSFERDPVTGEDVRIDGYVELEVDREAVGETCEHCLHTETIEERIYKIPEQATEARE